MFSASGYLTKHWRLDMDSVTQTTFIYALVDPRDGRIRYVGKANDPQVRLRNHVKESRNGHSDHKARWVRLLLRENLYPQLLILEECYTSEWKERECFYIADFRAKGYDLVNAKDGGDGLELTDEVRAKMSAAKKGKPALNKGKPASLVTRIKQSISAKLRWHSMTKDERRERTRYLQDNRKPISENTREKFREIGRNRIYTPERNHENSLRQRKLNKEQVIQIRQMLFDGRKQKDIACAFGISEGTISEIKKGTKYADWFNE
jgi:DNA-binding NarL/FixJ family response regulator